MLRYIYITLLSMILCSCAAATHEPAQIFQVGELEVRLYQDREEMVKNLPPIFALLEATRVGDKQIKVFGYYDRENKRIYAVNDAKTVIHEFKHYLEPEWKHEIGTTRLEATPRGPEQDPPESRASAVYPEPKVEP